MSVSVVQERDRDSHSREHPCKEAEGTSSTALSINDQDTHMASVTAGGSSSATCSAFHRDAQNTRTPVHVASNHRGRGFKPV